MDSGCAAIERISAPGEHFFRIRGWNPVGMFHAKSYCQSDAVKALDKESG
jgi:hypothetical protein